MAGKVQSILKYGGLYYKTLTVVSATYIVSEKMAAADTVERRTAQYALLAERMGSNLYPQTVFGLEDFKSIAFPTGEKRVLLLWSRYTGGNTPSGYNPAGDSDLLGQKQLLLMAEKTLGMFDVISVGHDPAGSTEKDWVHAKCHIGEFYLKSSIGSSRGRHLSFMFALMQKYPGKLFQIGQKTGGMDAGAMVGIPTLYIEDSGSWSNARMQTWVGRVPFYESALVNEPPTLLGRALRATDAELTRRSIIRPRLEEGKKPRRWAQYFYVLNYSASLAGNEVDIMALADEAGFPMTGWVPVKWKTIEDTDEMTKKFYAIDAQIAREATSLQDDGYPVKEYSPGKGDIDLLQQKLVNLVASYDKSDAVVRNSSG